QRTRSIRAAPRACSLGRLTRPLLCIGGILARTRSSGRLEVRAVAAVAGVLIRMEDGVDLLGDAGGHRVGDRAPVGGDVLRDEVVGAGAGELGGAVLAGQPPGRV